MAKSDKGHSGEWTMIYDEGMDIKLGEHRFTANFNYFPDKSGKVMTNCGKTIVGWYHNQGDNKKSCFKATKIVSDNEAHNLIVEPLEQISIVQPNFLQKNKQQTFLGA